MKHKKFLAIGSALLLVAGIFTVGAGAASAGGNTNSVEYWQALYPNAVSCYKYDGSGGAHGTVTNGGDAVTLNAFQQSWPGDRWEVLIVKGGSVDYGSGPGNVVYNLPSAGVAYFAPQNAGGQQAAVSHWIVCKGQSPVQSDASAAISFTPPTCDVDQKLVLGSIANATWGAVAYSGTGNRNFSVTATATDGHKFADGKTTKTFTGTLVAATGGCNPPPCLPKSAVSYTYNAATNSGVITVAAMDGYSNELCKPFWVTAASWTFDGSTQWPQTLDQWNPANSGNAIATVGTYPYAATVDCGQGDIYATFTAPGVPATTGVLNGPSNPYKEYFLHQMGFTGPTPTYTVDNPATCGTIVIVMIPGVSFTDECGTANDTVNVPTKLGVVYTTVDNRVNGVGTVTVTASAAPGYAFDGSIRSTVWSHDFTDEPCVVSVDVVPAVTFTDECATANDAVSVPKQTGVVYTTADSRDANGVGNVTVTAAPAVGYVFGAGVTTTSWSHDFTNEPCVVSVDVVPAVTFTDECATANDAVSVPKQTGVVYLTDDNRDGNGVGNVTVTAMPASGYVFGAGVTTTSWSHDFTNEACMIVVQTLPSASFTDECATANDVITVPKQTGAVYTTTDGRDGNRVGTVTVTAVPAAGYVFADGATTSWTHEFTNELCPTVQPIAPQATDPMCVGGDESQNPTVSSGYIDLDLKDHLQYKIDGVSTTSARNNVDPGVHTVSVTVDDGFTLTGPESWELTVNEPFCPPTLALLSTSASMTNTTCISQGSYTLANTAGIQWFVNGSSTATPAGTYTVDGASTVNVEAKLVDTVNDGWEDGAQKNWTFTFTDPSDCLPTLAFTGSTGNSLGLLLAGGLLLIGGAGMAFDRRYRLNAK